MEPIYFLVCLLVHLLCCRLLVAINPTSYSYTYLRVCIMFDYFVANSSKWTYLQYIHQQYDIISFDGDISWGNPQVLITSPLV